MVVSRFVELWQVIRTQSTGLYLIHNYFGKTQLDAELKARDCSVEQPTVV